MPDNRAAPFRSDYALSAALEADVVHKGDFWSEELRRRGLHAEGVVMHELVSEIMFLRGVCGAQPSLKPARRGPRGDASRG